MIVTFIFISGSTLVFFYIFIKLWLHEKLYKGAKPIENINRNLLKDFRGLLLLVDKNSLIQSSGTFKKVFKKMSKLEKESLIITYDPKLFKNESDVEFFRDLCVSFVPCVIKANSSEEKKFITYKVEEF